MKQFLLPLAIGMLLLTSACTSTNAGPPPSGTPMTTSSADPTPATTSPSPQDETITESNAYELCIAETRQYLSAGDPANVTYAPRTEATSLVRDDGYVGIYIEVSDGNNQSGPDVAINCIIGGTVANPDWYSSGLGSRSDDAAHIEDGLRSIHTA